MNINRIGKIKIYYKGHWDDKLFAKCMGVVGSRKMTSYGQRVIERIVPQLVIDGWTIVSGFMYGVDLAVHRQALECGGKTIAVLGWGIDNEMPGIQEQELENRIIESKSGLLLSLWKNQLGTNWTFPARNKVVAEICHELIVVEAAAKSGALLTATMVRNLGKKVWAVPGPITSSVSAGTNNLIAAGQAEIYLTSVPSPKSGEKNERSEILKLLQNEGLTANEIARQLNRPAQEIATELSLLLLTNVIVQKEDKYHAS